MPVPLTGRRLFVSSAIGVLSLGIAAVLWQERTPPRIPEVYSASGYGGYLPAPHPPSPAPLRLAGTTGGKSATTTPPSSSPEPANPVKPARDSYKAGRYDNAWLQASAVLWRVSRSPQPGNRQQAAEARLVLAYSAARQRNFPEARTQFALLQQEAAAATRDMAPGNQITPRIEPEALGREPEGADRLKGMEEDASYQHAVLTAAMGDQKAAEAEYLAFIKQYPESPLVQASIKRIARMHGGDVPKNAEAVWRESMAIAQTRTKERQREQSLCAPEVLAELLRRAGKPPVAVEQLAIEMGTSDRGTTLEALAQTALQHGFQAEGDRLTVKGLLQQPLPLVALITPGHYVLVDRADESTITVWDPDGQAAGKSASRSYTTEDWQKIWGGIALVVRQGYRL